MATVTPGETVTYVAPNRLLVEATVAAVVGEDETGSRVELNATQRLHRDAIQPDENGVPYSEKRTPRTWHRNPAQQAAFEAQAAAAEQTIEAQEDSEPEVAPDAPSVDVAIEEPVPARPLGRRGSTPQPEVEAQPEPTEETADTAAT